MELPHLDGYTLESTIGHGATGTVYRARGGDGVDCAVKVLNPISIKREVLDYTFRKLASVTRPGEILTVYEYSIAGSPSFVSMPLMGDLDEAGNLVLRHFGQLCGNLSGDEAWPLLISLVDGLSFLHKHGIAHCNIKASNIFFDREGEKIEPRIADISLGWLGAGGWMNLALLLPHMPPEQLREPKKIYEGAAFRWDVYAFGVLAYQLLSGRLPRAADYVGRVRDQQDPRGIGMPLEFDPDDYQAVLESEEEIDWGWMDEGHLGAQRREVIERCLALDPARRWIDLREVHEALVEIDRDVEEARLMDVAARERHRQRAKRNRARAWGAAATVSFLGACAFGFWKDRELSSTVSRLASVRGELEDEIGKRDVLLVGLEGEVAEVRGEKMKVLEDYRELREQNNVLLTSLLDPDADPKALLDEGQLHAAIEFYQDRCSAYGAASGMEEDAVHDYFNLAVLQERVGDEDGAVVSYKASQAAAAGVVTAGEVGPEVRLACLRRASGAALREYELLLALGEKEKAKAALQRGYALFETLVADGCRLPGVRFGHAEAGFLLAGLRRGKGEYDEAGSLLLGVLGSLEEMAEDPDVGAEVQPMLARGHYALGLVARHSGKGDEAVGQQLEAIELLLPLIGDEAGEDEVAVLLAQAYTELGELVSQTSGPVEALVAHQQAVALLSRYLARYPEDGDGRCYLARNYGQLSAYHRDAGEAEEALRKQEVSVAVLGELLEDLGGRGEEDGLRYRLEHARQRVSLAELLGEAGRGADAIKEGGGALEELGQLLASPGQLMVEEHMGALRACARVEGILGHNQETAGNKELAAEHFSNALKSWEELDSRTAGKADNQGEITRGVAWCKGRIASLIRGSR